MVTKKASRDAEALAVEMLGRVADKWTLLILWALEDGELRFTRLRERVDGISQKMLTQTLRSLERDGLVIRRVHAVIPPRVDYRLTPLGRGLSESTCGLWRWASRHVRDVERARRAFKGRSA